MRVLLPSDKLGKEMYEVMYEQYWGRGYDLQNKRILGNKWSHIMARYNVRISEHKLIIGSQMDVYKAYLEVIKL